MTRSDYNAPTFTDVPQSQWSSPPAGAVALDSTHLNAMAQAIANSARQAVVDVRDYGAKGDGATDDTAAIAAALAAVPQLGTIPDAYDGVTTRPRMATLYFPDGTYRITAGLTLPQNTNVLIAPGATIRASTAMTAVIDTAVGTLHQDGFIDCQGVIDCNSLASYGIYLRKFARYIVRSPRVYSPAAAGIVLGDPAATSVSYEAQVVDPYVWRPNGQAVPASSIGIWMRNATDSLVGGGGSVVVGCAVGVQNDSGNNTFKSVHPWGYPPNTANGNSLAYLPGTCFLDNSTGGVYIDCYADTPSQYGFRFTADNPGAQMIGCRVYKASQAPDNTMTAVQVDSPNVGSLVCLGLRVQAGSSAARIATDFAGTLGASVRIGTKSTNVVTVLGDTSNPVLGTLPTVTTSTTLTADQYGCIGNAPGGSAITIPAAFSVYAGKIYVIHNLPAAGSRLFVQAASGTIDGSSSLVLGRGDSIWAYSDGTNWSTVSRSSSSGFNITPFALTSPPVSATAYQNTSGRTIFLSVPYTPTGAGSLKLEISRDGTTYVTWDNVSFAGAGAAQYMKFQLPNDHWYKLTATAATLGTLGQFG